MSSPRANGDFKAQVLAAVDIVDLVGRSVALKRRGKSWVGLCPFHQEKTGSFSVNPEQGYFYCFGCKAKGNAIDFVMRRDRIEFIEALKLLGEQVGIEMPRYGVSKEKTSERQLLLEAHSATCSFFENLLAHPTDGKVARDYLEKRGFTPESIRRFQIGLAVDGWDALLRSPVGRKYDPQVLHQAGLVKAREGRDGYYDTFRNRLMFPIRDVNGRVIAFGGRRMNEEDNPKYLNSPETPLFSKSRCIFGIDLARQRVVETRTIAVVEGYTDVVMAHQHGVSNVVSILGTAMTSEHVSIMRRFADRIVLLFDPDSAGDAAVDRAVELLLTQPVDIAIATIPTDADPDEYLMEQGPDAFNALLRDAPDALTYKWKQLSRRFDESDDLTARSRAVEQYMEVLAAGRQSGPVDSIRWGQALARVSRLTDMPVDELSRRFKTNKPRHSSPAVENSDEGAKNPELSPAASKRPVSAQDRAERWILAVLLAKPEMWHCIQHAVGPGDFLDEYRRKLAEIYWQHQRDEGEPQFRELLSILDADLSQLAVELVDEVETLNNLQATLEESAAVFTENRSRQHERRLLAELRRTTDQPLGEEAEVDLLTKLQEQARKPNLRRV